MNYFICHLKTWISEKLSEATTLEGSISSNIYKSDEGNRTENRNLGRAVFVNFGVG